MSEVADPFRIAVPHPRGAAQGPHRRVDRRSRCRHPRRRTFLRGSGSARKHGELTRLHPQGYGKVLAKGRLPAYPIILKARYVSRRAEKKINEAGGVVVISA
jgi:hypothetical protein